MPKRIIEKGNIHPLDYFRVLVTETIPGDIPVIISNDYFWRNMKSKEKSGIPLEEVAERILAKPRNYTRPYRYNILRPSGSTRRLSLLHPASQLVAVDFYRRYEFLICYYCRKSPASIRSPRKVASLYFIKSSSSRTNRLRISSVDTVSMERAVSNPASYFAYKGHNRFYKFFASQEFINLERKFSVMRVTDVAKCFSSIYTHTLAWAVASVDAAKESTAASTFSNSFDDLMHKMNYNETNGICIGPEISRIFAELILSEVDKRTIDKLKIRGLVFGEDYEFRRYVDDIYIFSLNSATSARVSSALASSLGDFNLHLSSEKTEEFSRPFITSKTRSIRASNAALSNFFEAFLSWGIKDGRGFLYPKRIRRPLNLLRHFLDSIKSSCFDQGVGYETVANYIISALADRLSSLAVDMQHDLERDSQNPGSFKPDEEDYLGAFSILLEAMYFFYMATPSVPSSLRISQSAIEAADAVLRFAPQYSANLCEKIVKWTFEFLKKTSTSTAHADADCVALEALNVLLVLGEIGGAEVLAKQAISECCRATTKPQYFEIVTFLFCMKDDVDYQSERRQLVDAAKRIIAGDGGVRISAQAAHLALDLLTCPYLRRADRVAIYKQLRAQLQLPVLSNSDAEAAAVSYEGQTWFVNWRQPNLLRMIQKKELSSVY